MHLLSSLSSFYGDDDDDDDRHHLVVLFGSRQDRASEQASK